MLDKRSQIKLEKYMAKRKRNIARLIYITYRYFNEWTQKQWTLDGWKEMRPEHWRLISIISIEAVSNNELAKRARVSKQAMSKMVNDLVAFGYVDVEPDPADSRAKIISISKKGVDFLEYLGPCGQGLEEKFHAIIGTKKTEQLITIMAELTEGILTEEKGSWIKK